MGVDKLLNGFKALSAPAKFDPKTIEGTSVIAATKYVAEVGSRVVMRNEILCGVENE